MPTIPELVHSVVHEAAFNEEISILIFGPGKPKITPEASKYWMKRNKIKNFLNEKFPNSKKMGKIAFPEDLVEEIKITGQSDFDVERDIASVVDLIIILDCSTNGVTLEIGRFSSFPWFKEKSYLFLPEKYLKTEGLAKSIHEDFISSHIIGFTDVEFESCQLVTEKILKTAQIRAISKMIQPQGKVR